MDRGAVNSICIHPSNKVALSVGADNKLVMWNLVKGCKSTTRKLNDKPTKILFNPDGSRYAILSADFFKTGRKADTLFSTTTA